MSKKFNLFIGIDQTGATNKNGKPKSLPVCLIYKNIIYPNLWLSDLKFESLSQLIQKTLNIKVDNLNSLRPLILIDSVFTLPSELKITHHQLMTRSNTYKYNNKSFGAVTAFNFFNSFLTHGLTALPQRKIELKLKANSVFKLKPFQRNIGCGSYRVLKELSADRNWFKLWPVDKKQNAWATIAEGYPSFYWKTLFNLKNRPQKKSFKFKNTIFNFKTTDHMDAFVLAIAAQKYNKLVWLIPNAISQKEGWVLGVT